MESSVYIDPPWSILIPPWIGVIPHYTRTLGLGLKSAKTPSHVTWFYEYEYEYGLENGWNKRCDEEDYLYLLYTLDYIAIHLQSPIHILDTILSPCTGLNPEPLVQRVLALRKKMACRGSQWELALDEKKVDTASNTFPWSVLYMLIGLSTIVVSSPPFTLPRTTSSCDGPPLILSFAFRATTLDPSEKIYLLEFKIKYTLAKVVLGSFNLYKEWHKSQHLARSFCPRSSPTSHPSLQQPSSGTMAPSVSTRSKMEQNMTRAGSIALADTLECPKAPGERWCWNGYLGYGQLQPRQLLWGLTELCSIAGFNAAIFLVRLAVAIAGLGMLFGTVPAVQASGFEAGTHHLSQPHRSIDPDIYLPLSKSLNASGHLLSTTETLAQAIQNRHASAQLLAVFTSHDLPCALRNLATGDGRLRSVLSHGHKLSTYDRTLSATLRQWYDTSSPYYYAALKDTETARDKAKISWYQNIIRRHQPIPFFLAYKGAWKTQKDAQRCFEEVSLIFANYEADREALFAERDLNENFATELFKLRRSLDQDIPGPWNRTDALALKRWYFHQIVGLRDRKLDWASFKADFDGLVCDPVWQLSREREKQRSAGTPALATP